MVTQEEIRKCYEGHKDKIAELNAQIAGYRAMMQYNMSRCKHPNGYDTSTMGELGFYCPDCGKSR